MEREEKAHSEGKRCRGIREKMKTQRNEETKESLLIAFSLCTFA
jgi:hypothetical protein